MVQKWIENSQPALTPFESARVGQKKLDASYIAQSGLNNTIQQQNWLQNLSPEEQETSKNLEEQLHDLLKKWDVIRLNEILRDPALKQFISGQLQNEIFAELRSISMDKVRGHIRDGNMGAVTEEMSGRLNEVKKWYGDIFQRLAEELNKPEVLTEDRETIAQLQSEVEEAETMVDQLLSSINTVQVKENMPPSLKKAKETTWINI